MGRCNIDGTKAVEGAAEHFLTGGFVHREGFTGHDRLIHRGLPAQNGTIHRNCFAGQYPQNIALLNLRSRDPLFPAILNSASHGGGQVKQFM